MAIIVRKLAAQLGYQFAPGARKVLQDYKTKATDTAKAVSGFSRDVNGKLRDARGRFVRMGHAGEVAGGQIAGGLKTAGDAAKQARGSLSSFGMVLERAIQIGAGLALVALGGLVRELVGANVEFENLNAQLITVTGSEEAAAAAFEKLEGFAARTPFQLEEVVRAFSKLKALGLDPSEEALESYGNTASAMGKTLNDMIEAVADASTGEFERLKEFGIKAKSQGNKVTFTFKGIKTTVGKNAAEIEAYLRNLGNTEFKGGMDRQALTIAGLWSTLKDNAKGLLRAVGQGGLNAGIKTVLNTLLQAGKGGKSFAADLGAGLGKALDLFARLIVWSKENIVWLKRLGVVAGLIVAPYTIVLFAIQDLLTFMRGGDSILGRWLKWAESQGGALAGLAGWIRRVIDGVKGFAGQLQQLARGEAVDGWLGRAVELAKRFIAFVRTDGVDGLRKLWEAGKPLGEELARVFNAIFEAGSRAFEALRPLLQRLGIDTDSAAGGFETYINILVFGLEVLVVLVTKIVDLVVFLTQAWATTFEFATEGVAKLHAALLPVITTIELGIQKVQQLAKLAGGVIGRENLVNIVGAVAGGGGASPGLLAAAAGGGGRNSATTNQQASIGQVVVNQQFANGDPSTAAAGLGGAIKSAAGDALGGLLRDIQGGA